MRTRSFVLSAGALAVACGAVAFLSGACSLGLDPSLIPGSDGGSGDAAKSDASNAASCNDDSACKSTNACLTGTCDTTRHQCVYALCPATACNSSTCDPTAHTCSAPAALPFHAGGFHVSIGSAGCGGGGTGARKCFAVSYPFVFVGTTNGVVAYSVADPKASAPTAISVGGLPFLPSFIVASGKTVYFVGAVSGSGPSYKVPLASLTTPGDPTVTSMTAKTVFDTVSVPTIDVVAPDTAGGVYLVRADGAKSYPAARIAAPLQDLASVTFSATTGLPNGSSVVAASGTRLVTFRQLNGTSYDAFFSLETAAATNAAQNAGEQSTLPSMGQTNGPSYFAQSPTGGLLWSTASVKAVDAGVGTTQTARLAAILPDQTGTKFDGTTHVEVSTYNASGFGGDLPGPVAWVDDSTVIVISAVPSNTAQSLVQMATRTGLGGIVPNRSFQIAFHPSELAIAASNGFGYVLTPDVTSGANVQVFATGCNN